MSPRRFTLTDKHGISRTAYSLQVEIRTDGGRTLELGLSDAELPDKPVDTDNLDSAEANTIDGHSISLFNKRADVSMTEE